MTPCSPLQLGNTWDEIADHEAGHAVVGHWHGMEVDCVIFEVHGNAGCHGCVQWASGAVPNDLKLGQTLAGILAQAKGLAARHSGEDLTFAPEQVWGELEHYLRTGEGNPPDVVFLRRSTGTEVRVSAAVSEERFETDRCNINTFSFHLCLTEEGGATGILRETAEMLDRPKVWERVCAVAQRLKDVAPVTESVPTPHTVRKLPLREFAHLLPTPDCA